MASTDPSNDRRQQQALRRQAQREARVEAGLAEFVRWLEDVFRMGLAEAVARGASLFEPIIPRLVDAQAKGLAARLRDLEQALPNAPEPETLLLRELAYLHGWALAYQQETRLEPDLRRSIRTRLGWDIRRQEVLDTQPLVQDRWHCLGEVRFEQQMNQLLGQRLWFRGEYSGRFACRLTYAREVAELDTALQPGSVYELDLHYYPAAVVLRAVFPDSEQQPLANVPARLLAPLVDFSSALDDYSQALARDPFLEVLPLTLDGVYPVREGDAWQLVDFNRLLIPAAVADHQGWTLLAMGGGGALTVFGEWHGGAFHLLSADAGYGLVVLGRGQDS